MGIMVAPPSEGCLEDHEATYIMFLSESTCVRLGMSWEASTLKDNVCDAFLAPVTRTFIYDSGLEPAMYPQRDVMVSW